MFYVLLLIHFCNFERLSHFLNNLLTYLLTYSSNFCLIAHYIPKHMVKELRKSVCGIVKVISDVFTFFMQPIFNLEKGDKLRGKPLSPRTFLFVEPKYLYYNHFWKCWLTSEIRNTFWWKLDENRLNGVVDIPRFSVFQMTHFPPGKWRPSSCAAHRFMPHAFVEIEHLVHNPQTIIELIEPFSRKLTICVFHFAWEKVEK